jgi:hypothetical protein
MPLRFDYSAKALPASGMTTSRGAPVVLQTQGVNDGGDVIPFVERLIGTLRREYLDHVLFWTRCGFRLMPAGDSGASRASVPGHAGPVFRSMPA